MKRYGPYIFVIIAICFYAIPFKSHALILKTQEIIDKEYYINGSPLNGCLSYNYCILGQSLGNNLGGSIYAVGLEELFTSTLGVGMNLDIMTCNTDSYNDSTCTHNYSDTLSTDNVSTSTTPKLDTYTWSTPVSTTGKYVFLLIPRKSQASGAVYYRHVFGSSSDTYSEGNCFIANNSSSTATTSCSTYAPSGSSISDLYFIIAGENSTFLIQPPNNSTWYVNPQGFVANIPGSVASTTIKWNVHFGQISGTYTETSDYGYINYTSVTGQYMIPTNYSFAKNATSTWYAKPYIYADYNNDGVWTLVKTGDESSFTVAPASVVYSGGYSGLDGQMHYYNLNNSVTGLPATTTAACSDTNGISYYFCVALTWAFVPPDCVISTTGQTSCTSFTRFSTVLDAYSEKAPWGYYGRFKQLVNDMASSTTATSTFSGLTDWLPTSGPLYTFIDYFKTGTAVLIWFTSVAFTLKIATLFL